jgi:peptide/nickel transport system substrate-binding protein
MRLLPLALAAAMLALPATAKTFRMATTSDAATLDPHANNAFSTYLITGQVYESLTRRTPELKVEPELAVSWQQLEPTRWRFVLRQGVRFHNGNAFDADDVVFSIARTLSPTSNFGIYVDTVERAEKVDAHTVDIITRVPDAVIPDKLTRVLMMDKEWAEANNATRPQNLAQREETFSARNMNGTGPFTLRSRENDVRTVLVRNPAWWGGAPGPDDVTEYHHVIIASDATRVAALLSGEVDMLHTVPSQDVARIQREQRMKVLIGQENRTVWLGMDQASAELANSTVKGRNPFKDARVREAVSLAIDVEPIRTRVLRGQAVPTASMWTQYVTGYDEAFAQRPAVDLDRARRLLAEAGYPNGFTVRLDVTTDRYVNDREVGLALVGMLSRVGINVQLNGLPRLIYFPRMRTFDTSFQMSGWLTLISSANWAALLGCVDPKTGYGRANYGRYCSPELDRLIDVMRTEMDEKKRQATFYKVPLYFEELIRGTKDNITMPVRVDEFVLAQEIKFK